MTDASAGTGSATTQPTIDGRPIGIADDLDDAIAVLGAEGTLIWANQACARLLGTAVDEVVGMNALALIHPDEVARALDGISYSLTFPERTAVVPFRIRHRDGSWVPVELKSSLLAGASGDLLALVIRDTTTRSTLASALGSVAAGEDADVTARWITRAVTSRWPTTAAGVLLLFDDEPVVVGDGLDPSLHASLADPLAIATLEGATATGSTDDAPLETPWITALRTGRVIIVDRDDLPPVLAAAATRLGFEACGAAPVSTAGHGTGVVVAWFPEMAIAAFEFAHAMVEMCEILSLAAQRRHHLDQLHAAARRDALTGLGNRAGFLEELADLLASTGSGSCAGLLYVDLDGFKPVNDEHGHAAGDLVLAEVADRLQTFAGDAIVARIGGDEFGLAWVLPAEDAHDLVVRRADQLVEIVGVPLEIPDPRSPDGRLAVVVGASIGIAVTDRRVDPEQLLEQADAAMYQAKADGRGRWYLETPP